MLLLVNAINTFSETITLSLNSALEKALEKNKSIKSSEINLKNAELDKKQALKGGLPSISYSGNNIHEDGVESNKYNLSVSQNIFNGFKTVTAIKNSDKYIEYYSLNFEDTKNSIALDILDKYISILKEQKQLEVYQNSKKEVETNYQRVSKQYELGLVSKTDVLDLNYSLISIETSIIKTENSLEIDKLSLKNSLGINEDFEIFLEEISIKDIDLASIDISSDIQNSKINNSSIKKSKLTTQLTEASEITSKADMMPVVDLSFSYGNYQYIDGNISKAFENQNISFVTTLSISGTLFDWGKNIDSYTESKNNTKSAKYTENTIEETAALNIKKSYLELVRLDKLKTANQKALESSTENFKYQKKRYENQLISSSDYIDAENTLRESEINLIDTELSLYYEYNNYLTLLK